MSVEITFRQLESYLAAGDALSFRKAARSLGTSQASISRHIAQVEREVGVRLLERSKRTVSLTSAGSAFLEGVRKILDQAEISAGEARRIGSGMRNVLRVGSPTPVMSGPIPVAIRLFEKQFPEVRFVEQEMSSSDALSALHSGKIDLGFVRARPADRDLRFSIITKGKFVIVLPADHPLARRKEISLTRLAGERLITPLEDHPDFESVMTRLRAVGVQLEGGQLRGRIIPMVATGRAMAVVTDVNSQWMIPSVVVRPIKASPLRYEIVAAWRARNEPPLVKVFLSILAEQVKVAKQSRSLTTNAVNPA